MNPILAMLQSPAQNNLLSQINQIKNILSGHNADEIYSNMIKSNPQFKAFVEANRNKSVEQIASENGIDLNAVRKMI